MLLDGFDIQTTLTDSTRCGPLNIQDGGGNVSMFGADRTGLLTVNGNVEIGDSLAFYTRDGTGQVPPAGWLLVP